MSTTMVKLYYQNVRGLRTKSDSCFQACSDGFFDIIAFTETWLNHSHVDVDFFPNQYVVHRSDRQYVPGVIERGGGVLLAVRRSMSVIRRHDLELTNECVWLEIRLKGRSPLLIGNHYFPPQFPVCLLKAYLDDLGLRLGSVNADILILGDFNLAGVSWSSRDFSSAHFYARQKALTTFEFIDLLDLQQHRRSSLNVLDLVVTNLPQDIIDENCVELLPIDRFHPPSV